MFIPDVIIAIATGLFIYSLIHSKINEPIDTNSRRITFRLPRLLSGFSFSLYLIHYPILNAVYFVCNKQGFSGLQPNLYSVLLELLFVSLLCCFAYLFAKVTEAHTNKLRNFFSASLYMINMTVKKKAIEQ